MVATSTKKSLVLFFRYLTRIGYVRGFLLYLKLHFFRIHSDIDTGFLKHPISLRKGTTDLITFEQVYITQVYRMELIGKPRFILDCGANVGMTSVYFANRFPESEIIAVEPEQSNFKMLKENCKPYKNIHVVRKAISSASGIMEVVDNGLGHYGFSVKVAPSASLESSNVFVESTSIPELMREFHWNHIDLLKIDIEGSEKELFSNNVEYWLPKTNAIVVEIHDRFVPGTSTAVVRSVVQYDFSVKAVHEGFLFERNQLIT